MFAIRRGFQPRALSRRGRGSELWVTVHPSYLLRLRDAVKDEQERLFQADLAAVAKRLTALTG